MSLLTVLSEDTDILPYLHKNGLYPSRLYFCTHDFKDELAFSDQDSLFLIIIHGFTRFSMSELNILFEDLRAATEHQATVVIMSDIKIVSPDFVRSNIQFINYDGDLFFGRYRMLESNKEKWNTDFEDSLEFDPRKGKCYRREFWSQFIEFTDPCEPTKIGVMPERPMVYKTSDTKYLDKIIDVNLYKDDVN